MSRSTMANRWLLTTALIGAALFSTASRAQTVAISPDTTVELSGSTVEDHEVVTDNQMGTVALAPLGVLPAASDVSAYHLLPNGDQLYSLDITAELGGGLIAGPADVVRYDGVTDALEFDASAEGIPDGVIVDAVSVHSSGDVLLSFDTTVDLGGGVTAQDEDLVRFDGGSTYAVFFDGSAEAVPAGLDLDGADYRASDGHLFLSFDGSGSLGGVDFDDEDILEFDSGGPTWTLHYDGSGEHSELAAANVVAVPEPGAWRQFLVGMAFLCALHRARRGKRVEEPRGSLPLRGLARYLTEF